MSWEMLADLFGEKEPLMAQDFEKRNFSLSSKPSPPRGDCNLVGLDNQGSTCYLNSLIQQLFLTPEFLQGLFAIGPELLGVGGPEAMVRTIPVELQRLFARMLASDEAAVSTEDLTRSFGWTGSEVFQQHDVQELNRILFTAIEDSLIGLPIGSDLIKRYYRGMLVNQIRCQACGTVSERTEEYQDLCVPVAGHRDLTSALITAYVDTETLEGDNAYRCEACAGYVTASKGTKIRTLPSILTLSLLRFNFDLRKMERYKETGRFEFPMTLDMEPFVESAADSPGPDFVYDLVGVVIHRGSTHGGHYHAYLRDCLGLGHWRTPETQPIRMSDPKKVDLLEVESPLEMLQVILTGVGEAGMEVDKLGGEIVKQTGVSWNKRFKPRHGPLIKFVRRNDHVFGYNPDTKWVWVLDPSKRKEETKAEVETTLETEVSSSPASEAAWFDFNDSRLAPINVSEISKQFEGRESAYIVTYRLRSLDANRDGPGSLEPPQWLSDEVKERNKELKKAREEYERRIHLINISLLDCRHVQLNKGSLEINDEDEGREEVRIDCRAPVSELLQAVEETRRDRRCVSLLWRGIHCAFYIKTELLAVDTSCQINEFGISNGCKLLLWDGETINGVLWPHCHEVPFRMLLDCPICSPDMSIRVHGSKTPLWLCICEHWPDLDPGGVQVSKVCFDEHGSEVIIPFAKDDLSRTPEDLGLDADAHILVSDGRTATGRAIITPRFPALQGTVFHAPVKNCLSKDEENSPRIYVPFSPQTTVLEFRQEALRCCGFVAVNDMAAETRLRIAVKGEEDPEDLGPPLVDEWTLLDCGWDVDSDRAHVALERGQSVSSSQLFLTILPFDLSAECSVVINKTVTVGQLKDSAVEALLSSKGVAEEPADFSLQQLNWCDDPGHTYKREEISVAEAGMRHGDRLLLQKLRAVAPGLITFPVFKQASPNAEFTSDVAQGLSGSGWMGRVTAGLISVFGKEEEAAKDAGEEKEVTRLTVEQTLSVGELRAQVKEEMEDVEEATMRLRIMERGRCGAVLKSDKQTVQRARLSDARPLCVEILPSPRKMESSDVLLNIRMFDEGSRSYSPSYDLIWKPQDNPAPSHLYHQLSGLLRLSVEEFSIAKQLPDKHQWIPVPVDDSTTTGPERKKKGGAGLKKISLLKAPYGLRDGDTLGIKRTQAESQVTGEDFASAEDIDARKKMEAEMLERRQNRQSREGRGTEYFGSGGSLRPYRPAEAPLVIHVKRFT